MTEKEPEKIEGIEIETSEPMIEEAGETGQETQSLPPAPDKKGEIEKILKEKAAQGYNFSDKAIYTKIFNEIAQTVGCSYTLVAKVAKKHFNKSESIKKEVTSEKSKIILETVGKADRPPRKKLEKIDGITEDGQESKKLAPLSSDQQKLMLEFDQEMVLMAFENVAEFERFLFGASPSAKRLKRLATTISIFNQKVTQAGHPEQAIDISDKLLKPMLLIAIAGTFAKPVVEKWTAANNKKKKANGIEVEESMR